MKPEEAIDYLQDPIGKREKHDEAVQMAIKHDQNSTSKQPDLETFGVKTGETCADAISRQAAIDALEEYEKRVETAEQLWTIRSCKDEILKLPYAQPTLCGYDIEHLMLIADVLRKENLSPSRVTDALTDIGRIVSIVRDEFEETLRKSVEQSLNVGNSL